MGICFKLSSKLFISSLKRRLLELCHIFYLAHTSLIFKDITILPLDKLFIDTRIGITMFNVVYELLPKPLIQIFSKNRDIHSNDARNGNLLRVSTDTKNFT